MNGSVVLKRFIRYLYEYEQEKRMRNVGFVKVEQDEEQCMIHVHGKGLCAGAGGELLVYLFFAEQGECMCMLLGTVVCTTPALSETWKYARDDENFRDHFDRINGVILENEKGRRFASVWDDASVDISGMKILRWKKERENKEENGAENEITNETKNETENEIADAAENETADEGERIKIGERDAQRVPETGAEEFPAVRSEEYPGMQMRQAPPKRQNFSVRKIQRMELSKLARCEWKLANNQFLMHGYYNYHHLVFLENNNQFLLGVPGIYHEKEARAAESFGFGSFISADELEITLNPDEKNEEEAFGYWCRPVRRNFRWE